MTMGNKERAEKKEVLKKIKLDTDILEFCDLPEFRFETRERNQKAIRVMKALSGFVYEKDGIRTLGDLKKYIDENGWLYSRAYKLARFGHMGERSVEYFNKIINKYGLEPFGPLCKI